MNLDNSDDSETVLTPAVILQNLRPAKASKLGLCCGIDPPPIYGFRCLYENETQRLNSRRTSYCRLVSLWMIELRRMHQKNQVSKFQLGASVFLSIRTPVISFPDDFPLSEQPCYPET